MKYIFDFDDVIFESTRQRVEHIFPTLIKAGISKEQIEEYYKITRIEGFLPKKMIAHYLGATDIDQEGLYEELMSRSEEYINTPVVEFIKKAGRENCFLVTHGGRDFQEDKVRRAGVEFLFSEIIVLLGSKKEAVEKICEKYKDEEVIFIDDKPQYFEDLDFEKYPNLKTVLYKSQNLQEEIEKLSK